jgi:predicted dehydrogenase
MINIGIVGLGGMGTVHYHNYRHIDGCRVVAAVCNTEEGKERAKKFGLTPYASVEEMAEKERIDCVDVCTPTYLHKQHVMEALKLEKHVIVEKPIALRKKDAEEMYALAEEQNRLLFVGHVLQFTKETEILREAVESGKYGKPLDGYFWRLSATPKWSSGSWLFDKEKSGLIPFDLHIHDLDLIISLFGKPKSFTYTSCGREGLPYKEAYRIQYGFDGLHVTAEAAWYNAGIPFRAGWRIYLEDGLIEYDGEKVVLFPPEGEAKVFDLKEDVLIPTGINLPPTGMFYRELSHFIDCMAKGIPSERVGREQVLAAIEILENFRK